MLGWIICHSANTKYGQIWEHVHWQIFEGDHVCQQSLFRYAENRLRSVIILNRLRVGHIWILMVAPLQSVCMLFDVDWP